MNNNKIYITLDYELFFGRSSGSVYKSVLEPTQRLMEVARSNNVAFTFFVDAGMLCAMKKFASIAPELENQYQKIAEQLRSLKIAGHSLQLHIHPHWEDSIYANGDWVFDVKRYRLDQFCDADIERIVATYKAALVEVVGDGVHAFRAGGWCIQPFVRIGKALRRHDIALDSTLYRDGYMNSTTHKFDFRGMPDLQSWRFDDDPMKPSTVGFFTEIPFSVVRYSRWFYAQMVLHRIFKTERYRFMGDGRAMGSGALDILKKIVAGSDDLASIDGFRVRMLESSFNTFSSQHNNGKFVVIGHPKALCNHSFVSLGKLASKHSKNFSKM